MYVDTQAIILNHLDNLVRDKFKKVGVEMIELAPVELNYYTKFIDRSEELKHGLQSSPFKACSETIIFLSYNTYGDETHAYSINLDTKKLSSAVIIFDSSDIPLGI